MVVRGEVGAELPCERAIDACWKKLNYTPNKGNKISGHCFSSIRRLEEYSFIKTCRQTEMDYNDLNENGLHNVIEYALQMDSESTQTRYATEIWIRFSWRFYILRERPTNQHHKLTWSGSFHCPGPATAVNMSWFWAKCSTIPNTLSQQSCSYI